jgi:magnesium transporter
MITRFSVPHDAFEWIDISQPGPGELEKFARAHGLNPYVVRDCLDPGHLPKFEALPDGFTFVIFRFCAEHFKKHAHSTQELTNKLAIFYRENLLVTVHRVPAAFLQRAHEQCEREEQRNEPSEIVTVLLRHTLESFDPLGRELLDEMDVYEETVFLHHTPRDFERRLYFMKRKSAVTRRVLELTADVIARMRTTPEDASSFQDARDLHTRLLTVFNQIREDSNTLLNTHLSLAAQRNNEVMRVLTIFSAFFLPLTFIVGIYGMNFDVLPELRHPYGYYYTLAGMALVALLIYTWFRRKKWL